MEPEILREFFERDLRKYIEEIKLFQNDDMLWDTVPGITNSAGNLVLHIIGGLNHHIGATLGKTGYVRNRDAEFREKNISSAQLQAGLEELIATVNIVMRHLDDEDMLRPFPNFFDRTGTTTGYVLTQLLLHTNYHLGQVNYLRRILNGNC